MAFLTKKLGSFLATASALTVLPMVLAKPAAAAPVTATNIVTNGSFEDTQLSYGGWGIFNSIDGWNLSAGSLGSGIEVQNHAAGSSFDGNNLVELDSDGNTGIFQDLSTQVGKTYQLTFAFSARPQADRITNDTDVLNVNWGNTQIAHLTADSTGLADTVWKTFTYNLVATSAITRLSFNNFGSVSDTFGTYLDKVSVTGVTAVPEPGSIMGLLAFGAFGAISLRKRQQLQKSTVKA